MVDEIKDQIEIESKYKSYLARQKEDIKDFKREEGLVLPEKITINNRLTARLKYFDLNKFQGIADPSEYPYLEMDMKRVKINKHYFDDFKIKT